MRCSVCEIEKTRDEFPKVLCGRCKDCKYQYTKEWKVKNRDKVNANNKNWVENNREKSNESHRKNYHKYIERKRKINLEYYHKKSKENGVSLRTITRNGGKEVVTNILNNASCKNCGTKNDLCIHHKDNQGRHNLKLGLKPNNEVSNLEILCRACHSSIHQKEKKYGIENKR